MVLSSRAGGSKGITLNGRRGTTSFVFIHRTPYLSMVRGDPVCLSEKTLPVARGVQLLLIS
jgi:hypothetical protein